MLNKRHKTILFVTIVMTGSALLAGARLNEALGMMMLGAAFAWLIGGKTAFRAYSYMLRIPGRSWPWVRVLLLMVLGGLLLVAIALWSNFNSFISVAAMCVFGMLISPVRQLPTQKGWLKVTFWISAGAVFLFSVFGGSFLSPLAEQNAERMGQLGVYALIALPMGILWLVKGWKLILSGMHTQQMAGTQPEGTGTRKSTKWLYTSLFFGALILMLLLGLFAFLAFSESILPFQGNAPSKQPLSSQVIFLMLLTLWPYACWKTILLREPNTELSNLRRHKSVTIALACLFTTVVCIAVTFGIQNGNDRMSTSRIEESQKDFQAVASKIGGIKSRELKTTRDYINAYEELEPLLADFDGRLQNYSEILSEAQERDRNRGPLNIQRLYGHREKEWLAWDVKMFDLLRQDSQLTRKQVDAIKQMGELQEQYQVEFWEKNVRPLLAEENGIRQRLASLLAVKPSP
jgi:hypothetical protein